MSEWGRLQDALHDEFDRQGVKGVDVDRVIEHIVNLRDFFPGLLGAVPRAEGLDQIIVKMRRFAAARRRDGDKPVADSQATAAVVDSWANQLARLSRPSDEREGADR